MMRQKAWNVKAIGRGHKTAAISKLIKEKNPNFFGAVEAKHSDIEERKIKLWWNDVDVN